MTGDTVLLAATTTIFLASCAIFIPMIIENRKKTRKAREVSKFYKVLGKNLKKLAKEGKKKREREHSQGN